MGLTQASWEGDFLPQMMMSKTYGGCHCGNILVEIEFTRAEVAPFGLFVTIVEPAARLCRP
jgi:hypothetical protein